MTICDDGIDLAIYEHNLGNLFLSGAYTENAIYRHLGDTRFPGASFYSQFVSFVDIA